MAHMAEGVVLHGEAEFGLKVNLAGRDLAEMKPLAAKGREANQDIAAGGSNVTNIHKTGTDKQTDTCRVP